MKKIIFMVLAAAMFVGCYKVDIYWSDHPKQGRLVLVTDWSKRTTGVELPPNYTVRFLAPPGIVTLPKTRVEFPNLFDPGTYTLYLHNNAANIVMNGTVASVLVESGEIGPQAMNLDNPQQEVQTLPLSTRAPGEEYYSNAMPGFLFWGSVTQTIEADHDYEVIVPMRQITR